MRKLLTAFAFGLFCGLFCWQAGEDCLGKGSDMNDLIEKLIPALIQVESGGNPNAVGDRGRAVGVLQIHKCVVDDVNQWYEKNYRYTDRLDPQKSKEICSLYLRCWGGNYVLGSQKHITLEVLAKIWNGGPEGWRYEKSTERYWLKVKTEMERTGK
jgi:hypothetical protein